MSATLQFRENLITGYTSGNTFIVGLLHGSATTPFASTIKVLSDLSTDEVTVSVSSNYSRMPLSGLSITQDSANSWVKVDWVDATFASLGTIASGATAVNAVYLARSGTTDSNTSVLNVWDLSSVATATRTPDGSDFVVQFGSNGVLLLKIV